MMLLTKDVFIFSKKLAKLIGLPEAIVLQFFYVWIERNPRQKGGAFIVGSPKDIQDEMNFWTTKEIKIAIQHLEMLEVINSEVAGHKRKYSINEEALNELELNTEEYLKGLVDSPKNAGDTYIYNIYNIYKRKNIRKNIEQEKDIYMSPVFSGGNPEKELTPNCAASPSLIPELLKYFVEKVGIDSKLFYYPKEGRHAKEILEMVSLEKAKLAIDNALLDPFWAKTLRENKTLYSILARLEKFLPPEICGGKIDKAENYVIINGAKYPKSACFDYKGEWMLKSLHYDKYLETINE